MIKIFRQGNMSIYIEFDEEGNKIFLDMFNEILKGKNFMLDAQFDMGVVKIKKRGCMENLSIICEKNNEDRSVFSVEKGEVIWKFSLDDIEFGIEALRECSQRGYFSPAEFIRVHTPKNKKLDYTYCELKDKSKLFDSKRKKDRQMSSF